MEELPFLLIDDEDVPLHIMDDVPETYEVPADKAAIPVNHTLGREFGTIGSLLNSILQMKRGERDLYQNRASEIKRTKESIENLYDYIQGLIEAAGENAFELPPVIDAAFNHLEIQWGPAEDEGEEEEEAEAIV